MEFEGVIDGDGKIQVPRPIIEQFGKSGQTKLHVRLSAHAIHSALKTNDVSEEEIEQIGRLQLESRDQVITFLLSEGALKQKGLFRRRVAGDRKREK